MAGTPSLLHTANAAPDAGRAVAKVPTDLAEVHEGVEVVGARKQRPDGGPGGGGQTWALRMGQDVRRRDGARPK